MLGLAWAKIELWVRSHSADVPVSHRSGWDGGRKHWRSIGRRVDPKHGWIEAIGARSTESSKISDIATAGRKAETDARFVNR
jgi:hypothetical protein